MYRLELKIVGLHVMWITVLVLGIFTLLLFTSGENVDLVTLFFEIFMPMFITVVCCEVVKIKTDPALEHVLVNAQSYFRLVARRYSIALVQISVLSVPYMVVVGRFFSGMGFAPMVLTFFAPCFLLSSFGLFFSCFNKHEFAGSLAGGLLWLLQLLARGIMHQGVAVFFFLFASFFTSHDTVWLVNRLMLIVLACFLWFLIYQTCRERSFIFK